MIAEDVIMWSAAIFLLSATIFIVSIMVAILIGILRDWYN